MPKIAVIEDEDILRQLMRSELEKEGYEVIEASNGAIGWKLIQEEKPNLILLDLLMPVMSGYDVLTALRADQALKKIPCIVISNSGQADDLNRAFACGADDVLIKTSFDPAQLAQKVQELTNSAKSQ